MDLKNKREKFMNYIQEIVGINYKLIDFTNDLFFNHDLMVKKNGVYYKNINNKYYMGYIPEVLEEYYLKPIETKFKSKLNDKTIGIVFRTDKNSQYFEVAGQPEKIIVMLLFKKHFRTATTIDITENSKSFLKLLIKRMLSETDSENCCICLDETYQAINCQTCGIMTCSECIYNMIQKNNIKDIVNVKCSVCRCNIGLESISTNIL
jgi:predicted lactoylglutathione lyase